MIILYFIVGLILWAFALWKINGLVLKYSLRYFINQCERRSREI
jgi:hypothetical protein